MKEFLSGFDVEVEHIIPKSLLFDDSFANKVCACRKCNADKGNKTAFDFMKGKSLDLFDAYVNRVNEFYKDGKISKTKKEHLLTNPALNYLDNNLCELLYSLPIEDLFVISDNIYKQKKRNINTKIINNIILN